MRSLKLALMFAAFVGVILPGAAARAAITDGYVCTASYDPRPGQYGSYGSINISMYSLPDCGGSWLGSFYLLTTNADSTVAGFRYSSWQITVMLDQLLRAAAEGTRVRFGQNGPGSLQITFSRLP